MIKVAITGNIASGKSQVQNYLINKDIVVIDTDYITHDILIDKSEIAEAFIDYDVFEFGRLSKEKLSKLVFSQPELKTQLEDLVQPLILEEIEKAFKTFANEKYIFVSVPLLFEAGWESIFDKIILVTTDETMQLQRLMERNKYTKEEALLRINSQMPQESKKIKSDYIIENNSDIATLHKNIDKILTKLN